MKNYSSIESADDSLDSKGGPLLVASSPWAGKPANDYY